MCMHLLKYVCMHGINETNTDTADHSEPWRSHLVIALVPVVLHTHESSACAFLHACMLRSVPTAGKELAARCCHHSRLLTYPSKASRHRYTLTSTNIRVCVACTPSARRGDPVLPAAAPTHALTGLLRRDRALTPAFSLFSRSSFVSIVVVVRTAAEFKCAHEYTI